MSRLHSGVSLIELIMVIAVLSILVVLAYPAYQTQMTENRRTDGKRILLEIMHEQQKFYATNNTYTTDLVAGETTGLDYADSNGDGSVTSAKRFYRVTAGACAALAINQCVELTATPQGGQSADSDLTYNSRNEKTPASHW